MATFKWTYKTRKCTRELWKRISWNKSKASSLEILTSFHKFSDKDEKYKRKQNLYLTNNEYRMVLWSGELRIFRQHSTMSNDTTFWLRTDIKKFNNKRAVFQWKASSVQEASMRSTNFRYLSLLTPVRQGWDQWLPSSEGGVWILPLPQQSCYNAAKYFPLHLTQ